jgi:RNA polymerase sigma-70 factor (ECF subfamily)
MDDQTRRAMRLWALAQPTVSAFITAVVRDFSDRDDILQDVAVAVLDGFDSYDPDRPFTPWAIGIARNQIGLYLRRRRRDRHTFDTDAVANLAAAFEAIAEEESVLLERLRVCVARLGTRARRLCQLRYRDDLKPAAIAETLAMTANGVSKALQRVRAQLRACIQGTGALGRG